MIFFKRKTNVKSLHGIHLRKEDGVFKVRDDLGFEAHFKTLEKAFIRIAYMASRK